MKSELRSSTLLLVAMLGLSMVFGSGCTNTKKKPKDATQTPDQDPSAAPSPVDAKPATGDQASTTPSATDPAANGGLSPRSSELANDRAGRADGGLGAEPVGSAAGSNGGIGGAESREYAANSSGGAPVGEGIETRHGMVAVGDESAANGANADGDAPAVTPKKKHHKKKKKKVTADSGDGSESAAAVSDDEGDGGGASKGSYVVHKGDTLAKIAKKNHVSLKKLLKLNGLTLDDAPHLKVGTRLKLTSSHANAA